MLAEAPVRPLPDCQCPCVAIADRPDSARPGILRTVVGQPPGPGVFFSAGLSVFQSGDLVSDLDELVSQLLETLVVSHVRFGLVSSISWNAFRAFGTLQVTLQNIIGTLAKGLAIALFNEKLLTEGAAAEAINGLDFLKHLLTL